jgi:hypothetical protein
MSHNNGRDNHTMTFCRLAPLFALFVASTALARPELNKEELARLEKGDVLQYSEKVAGSGVMRGKAVGIIEDAPEAVIYVLLALDKYKHFLPRVTKSRVVKRKGWHTYAVIHTDLPWPVKDVWTYLKVTRYDKPGRVYEMKWWMLNGTMKQYTGSARVEPWTKDGKRSLLIYQLLAEPQTSAPDSVISDGVKAVASTILKRVRLRLKALRKFKKMPKGL